MSFLIQFHISFRPDSEFSYHLHMQFSTLVILQFEMSLPLHYTSHFVSIYMKAIKIQKTNTSSFFSFSPISFCSLFSLLVSSGLLRRTLLFREALWIKEKPTFPSYERTLSFTVELVCVKPEIAIQLFGKFYKLNNSYYSFEFYYCLTEENRGVLKNIHLIELF